jgi:hypothetical protein
MKGEVTQMMCALLLFYSPWQSLLSSLVAGEAMVQKLVRLGMYKLSLEDVDTLASLSKTMGYVSILNASPPIFLFSLTCISQADEQAQALDANGRRFLLAFSRTASNGGELSYAEATWALHSQAKSVNLQTVISQCHNQLILWGDVKRYKMSYWLEDPQIVRLCVYACLSSPS